jgi:hypothetical protein
VVNDNESSDGGCKYVQYMKSKGKTWENIHRGNLIDYLQYFVFNVKVCVFQSCMSVCVLSVCVSVCTNVFNCLYADINLFIYTTRS